MVVAEGGNSGRTGTCNASIQRAVEVGSVDAIISVAELRPAIIKTIEGALG